MDTKVIAMVGAVIVVGAAVYGVATGTVLPGTEDISDENNTVNSDQTNANNGNLPEAVNDEGGNGGENGDSVGENDTGDSSGENVTLTEEEEQEELEQLSYVCERKESDISREEIQYRRVAVGPIFDPIKFESMLHDRINKLRDIRSDADPLRCDPELREIARKHSELVVKKQDEGYEKKVEIKSKAERYEGVCENPRERQGTWYYQRDMELDPPDDGSDQRIVLIEDHEDMVRDVRGKWAENDGFIAAITNSSKTRQGVGAYIDRRTRKVVVTQVLCGDRQGENEGNRIEQR